MRTRFYGAFWGIATITALACAASADVPALSVPLGGTNFTNGTWSLGWEFTTNNAVTVTQLGTYDDFDNDLTESHDVGIFDNVGNLLGSGTVNPGDPLNGHFRYTSVTPFVLAGGQNYRIAATTGSENYYFGVPPTTVPDINFLFSRETFSTTLVFPTNLDVTDGIWGGNFQIADVAAVPEPGIVAFGLVAAGSVLGLVARRRKS